MSVFDETPTESPNRTSLVVGGLAGILLIGAGVWFFSRAPEVAAPTAAVTSVPKPAAPAPTKAEPPPEKTSEPAESGRRATAPKKAPATAPAAEVAGDATTLTIESDVPGASVFVDREFVGTAPVTLKGVTPGSKRVNLSAEGYEGVQRAVDVAAGENTLRATVDGLAHDTTNKGDAFTLKYDQVESFDVSYLEKNLGVKQRGGKTWNFTDRAAQNADKLFVFHRDVQTVRDKLVKGYSAAR